MEVNFAFIVGNFGLGGRVEYTSFAWGAWSLFGDVVETENHVLRGDGDRSTVGRVEDVERGQHKELRLEDGSVSEWEVDSHLVAIEVGIESGCGERVELDCFALDHARLEGLNAETVKSWGSVEKNGMVLHDILEDVPNHSRLLVDDFLGRLDGLDNAALNEFADDEGFVELGSHVFGEAALMHTEFGTDDDDGTSGVVDTLTEKVLTETTLLAFEAVGERLKRSVGLRLNGSGATSVVE